MQPIHLWSIATGPNPWKIAVLLEEMGLPYTTTMVTMENIKSKPFIDVNPNGRVPAIEDPNTGTTLWETAAIIQYLIDTYDKENKFTVTDFPQKWHLLQWLSFQVSGQGPYFGQAGWFTMNHPEKLPSAIKRYLAEIHRVIGVLDGHLATQPTPNLVGGKTTFADLAFVVYNSQIAFLMDKGGEKWDDAKYPHYKKWQDGMMARPAVQKVMNDFYTEMGKAYGGQS